MEQCHPSVTAQKNGDVFSQEASDLQALMQMLRLVKK